MHFQVFFSFPRIHTTYKSNIDLSYVTQIDSTWTMKKEIKWNRREEKNYWTNEDVAMVHGELVLLLLLQLLFRAILVLNEARSRGMGYNFPSLCERMKIWIHLNFIHLPLAISFHLYAYVCLYVCSTYINFSYVFSFLPWLM